MTLWLIFTLMIAVASAIAVLLVLQRGASAANGISGLGAYKAELGEIERKKTLGLMDERDADAARADIEKRILAAALSEAPTSPLPVKWQYLTAVLIGAIAVISSAGLYLIFGQTEPPDTQITMPAALEGGPGWAERAAATQGTQATRPMPAGQSLADVDTMIGRLEQRLEANPEDANGWRMLGWSYFNTQRFADAVKAYGRAVELQKDNPTLRSLLGEAMVKAANDMVTKEALAVFDQVLAASPDDERARYFKGLAKAQQGDAQGAIDDWVALYKSAPADAEWAGDLRTHIQEVAQRSGIDLGDRLAKPEGGKLPPLALLGPSAQDIENAKQLGDADRNAMVQGMVERLASRLESSPEDADGWIMLIRSRMMLNQPDEARSALERARKIFANAPETLTRVTEAAQALGVSTAAQ